MKSVHEKNTVIEKQFLCFYFLKETETTIFFLFENISKGKPANFATRGLLLIVLQ